MTFVKMKNPYICECIRHLLYTTSNLLNSPFTPVSSWLRPTSHRYNLTMLSLSSGPRHYGIGCLRDRIWHLCMNYSDILGVITMNHSASGVGGQWVNALLSSPIPHAVNSEVISYGSYEGPVGLGTHTSGQFSNLRLYRLSLHFSFTLCPSLVS